MAENTTSLEERVLATAQFLTNKKTRSVLFLIISFIIILILNALLPVIEGETHYTAEAVETTYAEFLVMKEEDTNYRLTWATEGRITLFKAQYILSNPGLSAEEIATLTVPDNMPVSVYTKFFYQHTFWYISTLISMGSIVLLFYSLFNYLLIVSKEKNERYISLVNDVDKMVSDCLDPIDFEPWIYEVFNKRRKIAQHKNNVKYNIDKLERKTSFKTKNKYKKFFKEEEHTVVPEPDDWKEIRYFNLKMKYLSLLDEDYINNFVIDGKVKYFKPIYPMFVYNGETGIGRSVDSYSLITTDSVRVSKDAWKKILYSLSSVVIFAILLTVTAVTSVGKDPLWIIINIIAKIAPLLIQIPLAIDYSNSFMDTQIIANLLYRRSIGLLFLGERKAIKNA